MSDEKKTDTEEKKDTSSKSSSGSKKSYASSKTSKKPVRRAPVPPRPAKTVTFDQWAARRGVPTHHRGGMRAFVSNPKKPRTLDAWDKCFQDY